jgi:hypothetical protein
VNCGGDVSERAAEDAERRRLDVAGTSAQDVARPPASTHLVLGQLMEQVVA